MHILVDKLSTLLGGSLVALYNTNTGSSKLHSEMLRLETKSDVETILHDHDVPIVNRFRSTNGTKACKLACVE